MVSIDQSIVRVFDILFDCFVCFQILMMQQATNLIHL